MDFRNLSIKELEENFNPRESVPNFDSYLSTTLVKSQKAKKLLSYKPTHKISEGLDEALSWYINSVI